MSWRELIAGPAGLALSAFPAFAADLQAKIQLATANGPGDSVGTVTVVG